MNYTRDYSIKMQDSTGRTLELPICGASIDDAVAAGVEWDDAVEQVESNAFANAIARGEIGADAWTFDSLVPNVDGTALVPNGDWREWLKKS